MTLRAELVIGTATLPAGDGDVTTVINPADQEVIGYSPVADESRVDEAVTSAAAAFPGWAALPVPSRPRRPR